MDSEVSNSGLKPWVLPRGEDSRNWDGEQEEKMQKYFHWIGPWSRPWRLWTLLSWTPCFIVCYSDSHDRCIAYSFIAMAPLEREDTDRLSSFRLFHYLISNDDLVLTCLGLSVLLYLDYCLSKYGLLKWVWDLDLASFIRPSMWRGWPWSSLILASLKTLQGLSE